MNDDYLLVRKDAIELDAVFWRNRAAGYEKRGLDTTSGEMCAVADAIELSQANVVYDCDGDAWKKGEDGKYVLRAAPSAHWALIEMAVMYGPLSLTPPEEPAEEPVGIGALGERKE